MNPELKLAAHMDKEDAQDNIEIEIEKRADAIFDNIEHLIGESEFGAVHKFQYSEEWADALSKYADRIAREELEG